MSSMPRVIAVAGRPATDVVRPFLAGAAALHLDEDPSEEVDGHGIHAAAVGRAGGPDGPVVRAGAAPIEATPDHVARNGRREEIKAIMADSDRFKVACAFEVNA